MVANDYTVRFQNRIDQVGKPVYPGLRPGRVVIELRLDGSMAIRFGDRYLTYHEVTERGEALGGAAPQTLRSLPLSRPTPEEEEPGRPPGKEGRPAGVQPAAGRSGRTSAEPYPPDGAAKNTKKGPQRQPQITPGGRASSAGDRALTPDLSIGRRRGHFYCALTLATFFA